MADRIDIMFEEVSNDAVVEVEASGRHIHLCQKDLEALFGEGYELTPIKDLSQPGQYACKERVTISGPKGSLNNVIVLGPVRPESQVEVSMTDANILGIKAPVRMSGDIKGTPGVTVSNGDKSITLDEGLMVAQRHLHITPEDAERFHINDGQVIKVKVCGEKDRALIFDDLVVRVNKNFRTYIHIDYDEANACGFVKGMKGVLFQ